MYKYLLALILPFYLFSSTDIIKKYDGHLYDEGWKYIQSIGIKKFKYHNCELADAETEIVTIKQDGLKSYTWVENNIVSDEVKAGRELLKLIILFKQKTSYESEKNVEKFFNTYKTMKNINILYKPVIVFKKKGTWYCNDEINNGLLYEVKFINPDKLKLFYSKNKTKLEHLLSPKSFLLFALLCNDLTITDKDVKKLNKFSFKNKKLLDVLLSLQRFDVVKHYFAILSMDYNKNPFIDTIKSANRDNPEDRVQIIRAIGFDIFRYSPNIKNYALEHDDDNLYLAIRYNLHTYKKRQTTTITIEQLVKNIPSMDKIDAYIYYGIQHNNFNALTKLLETHPNHKYTKHDISRYILYSSKSHSLKMMQYLVNRFPYEQYDDIVDEETGFNALAYAKEDRYSGEKRVEFLEEHNFSSGFLKDSGRNISNFFSDVGEAFSGVALMFGGGMGR